jgi:hypothetical protein
MNFKNGADGSAEQNAATEILRAVEICQGQVNGGSGTRWLTDRRSWNEVARAMLLGRVYAGRSPWLRVNEPRPYKKRTGA